jgi:hypothetical protein
VLKSKPARAAFAEMVRENLPVDQARVLYSLDKPVPADLWLLPNADSYS